MATNPWTAPTKNIPQIVTLGIRTRSVVLLLVVLITACNPAANVCWQCPVEGMATLTRDHQFPPEHLLQPDAIKTGEEFDVSAYFDVLDHLSMQPGYVLDYVYWYDEMGAHPVLYARRASEAPFETYVAYEAARGESPQPFLEHVQVDGSADGFFQLVILRLMGEQFYLWWHATMNDAAIITDQESLKAHRGAVEANCTEPFDPVLEGASSLALEPNVAFEGNRVLVEYYSFSSFNGLWRNTLSIRRDFPHTFLDESTEKLLDYFCGVVP